MAQTTILQHYIVTEFILPFLLMFAIVFAILEKSKILGQDVKQVNAIVAFVIGLIFVSALYPKAVAQDLILFMTIAIVVIFVFLVLYGFVATSDKEKGLEVEGWMKWGIGGAAGIAVIFATIWATGSDSFLLDFLFYQSWSNAFWTNAIFIGVVAVALAVILKSSGGGGK